MRILRVSSYIALLNRSTQTRISRSLDLEKMYLVNPESPLITNPGACHSLTTTALRVNLAAHASRNPAIVIGGTHEEMAERLKEILTRREMDLVVAQMLRG